MTIDPTCPYPRLPRKAMIGNTVESHRVVFDGRLIDVRCEARARIGGCANRPLLVAADRLISASISPSSSGSPDDGG